MEQPRVKDDYNDSSSEDGIPGVVAVTGNTVSIPKEVTGVNEIDIIVRNIADDELSGNVLERDYTGIFEGPEKTLEVVFRRMHMDVIDADAGEPVDGGTSSTGSTADESQLSSDEATVSSDTPLECFERKGLRQLGRPDLDLICSRARCTILSTISNRYLDAYVLSESSLFVYPYMLVLKTCGTTTLLRCIAVLIDLARKLGLEIDWVGYSRKNFNFPGDQAFPHQSFHQELDYLYGHRNLCNRLQGSGYTLGPVTGDHWFVFVADHTNRSRAHEIDTDRVLNIMMFDIDEDVAKLFYYDQYDQNVDGETKDEAVKRISMEQTVDSGIQALCPGAIIDARAFEPCGYSMNAILFHSYCTMHITPESGSSYASFETNQKVGSYKALINNVIRTFRPKRFVMTLMADEGGIALIKDNPLAELASASKIVVPSARPPLSTDTVSTGSSLVRRASFVTTGKSSFVYKRSSLASIKVEEDCCCMMGTWVMEKTPEAAIRADKQRGMSLS
jgi:S-adenosylmethionine decarboxylase